MGSRPSPLHSRKELGMVQQESLFLRGASHEAPLGFSMSSISAKRSWKNPISRQNRCKAIRVAMNGVIVREKESIAKLGYRNPMFGKSPTVEHRKKLIQNNRWKKASFEQILVWKNELRQRMLMNGNAGKKETHSRWLGGISFEPYDPMWDETLRERIRTRDHHTCIMPGCHVRENERKHDVHHIDYNKKNNIETNLLTLCYKCHSRTNQNRKYWSNFLQGRSDQCLN